MRLAESRRTYMVDGVKKNRWRSNVVKLQYILDFSAEFPQFECDNKRTLLFIKISLI